MGLLDEGKSGFRTVRDTTDVTQSMISIQEDAIYLRKRLEAEKSSKAELKICCQVIGLEGSLYY